MHLGEATKMYCSYWIIVTQWPHLLRARDITYILKWAEVLLAKLGLHPLCLAEKSFANKEASDIASARPCG